MVFLRQLDLGTECVGTLGTNGSSEPAVSSSSIELDMLFVELEDVEENRPRWT